MKRDTALITGATSGIGFEFAERFASMGYDLIITGRRKDVITDAARKLERAHGIRVSVVIADFTNDKGIRSVISAVRKSGRVSVLVNNAGFGVEGLFKDLPVKEHLNMLTVHVTAALRLTHEALPGMLKRKSGIIINVASLAAFTPTPINSIYGGTKAFLTIFTESLHMEVRRHGIRVQALCPGFTHTDFHNKMGVEKELNDNRLIFWTTPAMVVDASMKCLKKGKVICIPGFRNKITRYIGLFFPKSLYYRITEKLFGKYLG
jgi:uncharacterized protein